MLVNRLWHHHFGRGLVPTVDDFGHMGEAPSHPELLDHLASYFVENDWSLKNLQRLAGDLACLPHEQLDFRERPGA